MTVMGRIIKKLITKEKNVMQWRTQSGSIINNIKVRIGFTLPELSAKMF